jgi:hypothetical protein
LFLFLPSFSFSFLFFPSLSHYFLPFSFICVHISSLYMLA